KNSDLENNEDDCVLYELTKLEKLVAMHFANLEENQEVKFSEMFKFKDELIDNLQDINNDTEAQIHKLSHFFLLPIKSESHYY
ncbi:11565_t:CDS:1, partial [Cetraspora pellucida]